MPSSYFGERFFKSALQPLRYYTDPIARGIEYYGKPVSAALEIGIPAYGVYSRIKKDYSKPRNHPGTALISATADLDAYRLADEYMQQKYEDAQEEKMMRKARWEDKLRREAEEIGRKYQDYEDVPLQRKPKGRRDSNSSRDYEDVSYQEVQDVTEEFGRELQEAEERGREQRAKEEAAADKARVNEFVKQYRGIVVPPDYKPLKSTEPNRGLNKNTLENATNTAINAIFKGISPRQALREAGFPAGAKMTKMSSDIKSMLLDPQILRGVIAAKHWVPKPIIKMLDTINAENI